MSGLCGWTGGAFERPALDAMASGLAAFDHSPVHQAHGPGFAFAVAGSEKNLYQDRNFTVVVCGEPRWVYDNLQVRASEEGMARTIAAEYERRGLRILDDLQGAYALALNRGGDELLLAIDRIGIHSLHYAPLADGLAFGSNALSLNRHPAIKPEIDSQSIYNYVYFHVVPGPATVYKTQRRLDRGTYLLYKNGRQETRSYWQIKFSENQHRNLTELKSGFKTLLENRVRTHADVGTGAFLSGGTDSSTIAGFLTKVQGSPAATYSIGFDAPGYDEMEYARIAARHFATQHHEYYVSPQDIVDAIPQIAAIYDQPFGNASAVPAYYCAKMAKADGKTKLLGGDGGDELFGGNERYAKQYIFSLYERIPSPLRSGVIEPLSHRLGPVFQKAGLGKILSYIAQASCPMPERMETYNLLHRLAVARVFNPDFLNGIDVAQPLALLRSEYENARAESLINRMLATDLKFTLADNDLPKVTRMCELAGISSAFPLLDDEIVAFSATLPPELKLKGTKLRYFFKEALRDFLPAEIINKSKHGFGLPFGLWMETYTPLRELAYDSLSDLKNRSLLRPEFIEELQSTHFSQHAAYYGTMIWVLMMLEQWYKRHAH